MKVGGGVRFQALGLLRTRLTSRGTFAGRDEASFEAERSFVRAPLNSRVVSSNVHRDKGKGKARDTSLYDVPVEIQEALVLEDLLYVLMVRSLAPSPALHPYCTPSSVPNCRRCLSRMGSRTIMADGDGTPVGNRRSSGLRETAARAVPPSRIAMSAERCGLRRWRGNFSTQSRERSRSLSVRVRPGA